MVYTIYLSHYVTIVYEGDHFW